MRISAVSGARFGKSWVQSLSGPPDLQYITLKLKPFFLKGGFDTGPCPIPLPDWNFHRPNTAGIGRSHHPHQENVS